MHIKWLTVGMIAACIGIMGSLWGGLAFLLILLLLSFFQDKERERNQKWNHSNSSEDKIIHNYVDKVEHTIKESSLEVESPTYIIENSEFTSQKTSLKINSSEITKSQNTELKEQTEIQKIINKKTGIFREDQTVNSSANVSKNVNEKIDNSVQPITRDSFPYLRTAKALSLQKGWTIKLEENGVVIIKGKRKFLARSNDELMSFF
jgi:uncharacterized membrane protein YbaN (DUF454 family)